MEGNKMKRQTNRKQGQKTLHRYGQNWNGAYKTMREQTINLNIKTNEILRKM